MNEITQNQQNNSCLVLYAEAKAFDELYLAHGALLSRERLNRAAGLTRGDDRRLSLLSELLLIRAMIMQGETVDKPLTFVYGENGKPSPADRSGLCFNLSHSSRLAVCALSPQAVGVDAEEPREGSDVLRNRIFTPNESAEYELATDKASFFTRLWTQKESYIKLLGGGVFDMRGLDWTKVSAYFYRRTVQETNSIITLCGGTELNVRFCGVQ